MFVFANGCVIPLEDFKLLPNYVSNIGLRLKLPKKITVFPLYILNRIRTTFQLYEYQRLFGRNMRTLSMELSSIYMCMPVDYMYLFTGDINGYLY